MRHSVLIRLLVAALFLLLTAGTALAQEPVIEYAPLDNGTLCVTRIMGEGAVMIPAQHQEQPVTRIGPDAARDQVRITRVTLPEGIVAIDARAFAGCRALKEIALPQSLTAIGDRAFENCAALSEMLLPQGLESLGVNPFCRTGITVTSLSPRFTAENGLVLDAQTQTLIARTGADCAAQAALPQGLLHIGESALAYQVYLQEIILPDTLQTVGPRAFEACRGLEAITLPQGLTQLGDGAFAGCRALARVTFSQSLQAIGDRAFYKLRLMEAPLLPEGLTHIGDGAFRGCAGFVTLTLPGSLDQIGQEAFLDCLNLQTLRFGAGPRIIGPGAFMNCAVSELTLPAGVEQIGERAFAGCGKMYSAVLPEGLTQLMTNAFKDCSSLSSITLPATLQLIGEGALPVQSRLVATVTAGSYAQAWVADHGIATVSAGEFDWLFE